MTFKDLFNIIIPKPLTSNKGSGKVYFYNILIVLL